MFNTNPIGKLLLIKWFTIRFDDSLDFFPTPPWATRALMEIVLPRLGPWMPKNLWEPALELISSTGKVDVATNNSNFAKGRYKLIKSIWLDDTNNWFMVDSKLMKKYMDWRDIVKLEFNKDKEFDHYSKRYSAYMFYDRVPRYWRFAFGHEVSGSLTKIK